LYAKREHDTAVKGKKKWKAITGRQHVSPIMTGRDFRNLIVQ
jgi:hypothetical protein